MALALYDRVQQTGTANTTVSFSLTGSVIGFQSFSVVGNGNTTYYSAFDTAGNWETGLGTYSTTGPILTRTTIYQSSNSNAAVTFSGTVNVFVTYPSGKSVNLDASGNATVLGTIASANLANCTFPTLNQNTTGSAGSVANALTMNNGGAGAASNTTYNGSATQTISYNTIGASPLAGSSSLTTTGTVTSGTWSASFGAVSGANLTSITGANVTGTVANATTATTATTANALNTANNYQVNSLGVGTASSGTAGEIRATNNVTAYYSSDRNLKENIKPIDAALRKVEYIGGKTFSWTQNYISAHGGEDGYFIQKDDYGVIAQDVQSVFPMAVRTRKDGTLAVDYAKLVALAFQAIVELKTEIEELKRSK
jgi:hypothetical protein